MRATTTDLANRKPARNDTAVGRAQLLADPGATAAAAALPWAKFFGDQDVGAAVAVLEQFTEKIAQGDTKCLQARLAGQFSVLDAVFSTLIRLAASSKDPGPNLRLALRAQSQAVQTARAISELQHPGGFIGRQVNIAADGGQQQVNNGPNVATPARARGGIQSRRNELSTDHAQLEHECTRGSAAALPGNKTLAAVHRPENRRRQTKEFQECLSRHRTPRPSKVKKQAGNTAADHRTLDHHGDAK